ncbi:quinolinate synthase NadA [Porphyromonas miyakawae]|jgi:hypothetical protein|uniref:Quinolinate synthase n=1 Tax=Porphyromonas miyakawae TaxID=3137470 RepID=A0ABQ0E1H4_9PORP
MEQSKKQIFEEIEFLKKKLNAVILAHYYTEPDLQKACDFLGDSLQLSQKAAETTADVIVFCGVEFMAETAKIISPNKKVLIPVQHAGCTLAQSVTAQGLATWKKYHPNGLVVSYVNTGAEVKAETDWCVTSSNALKVVEQLPRDKEILFGPDKNLGAYISQKCDRPMQLWQGDCYVHRYITPEVVLDFMARYPESEVLIHPESVASTDDRILSSDRCHMGSTSFILDYPVKSKKRQFIIATESGILTEMYRRYPEGYEFIPIVPEHICEYMKLTTLEDLRDALLYERYEVVVPEEIRERAIVPIKRMLSVR